MFGWLNATAAKEFGAGLARFYIERIPVTLVVTEKKFAAKSKDVFDKMALQVARFKQANQLNTYKKAQLGNAFKWALRDGGYEPAYIDRLTEWLIARV